MPDHDDTLTSGQRGYHRVVSAAAVIGVGLSGFFDGILLHQVLQWHHLLSLVPGEALRDISNQILADGAFHVLMYGVTAAGLLMLWRARRSLGEGRVTGRAVAGGGLLGFGAWNVVDVGLFHWILGIHRIRVDVPDPMTYDLAWIGIFGLVPLVIGWLLLRSGSGDGSRHAGTAAATLSLLAVLAAPIASLPLPNTETAIVVFAPDAPPTAAFEAAFAAQSPVIWSNPDGTVMAVRMSGPDASAKLYRAGAWLVTRSPALAGCAVAIKA